MGDRPRAGRGQLRPGDHARPTARASSATCGRPTARWPRPCWPSGSRRSARSSPALPGLRLIQDNMIWKPPSGKALLCHQDAAYLEFLDAEEHDDLLDGARRHGAPTPARSSTSAARTTGRARRGRHVPRAGRLARPRARLRPRRRRARARADRGAGRRLRLPRRLDVPRQPAERARRRRAALDHLPHGLDRDDAGATGRRTRSTRTTGDPASASSTRRSSPSCGAATATAPPSSPPRSRPRWRRQPAVQPL